MSDDSDTPRVGGSPKTQAPRFNPLEARSSSAPAHKWYAIFVSITSGFEGTRATIQKSYVVKEHFDEAVRLDPADATARHLLGLWFFEVASLSWAARKLAAVIFAAPPAGSYREALEHFEAAETLDPGFWVANRLYLGKSFLALGDRASGRSWLLRSLELAAGNDEDRRCHAEARAQLQKD